MRLTNPGVQSPVPNTSLANMPQNTVKARVSAGAGPPEDTVVINAMMANMAQNTVKARASAGAGIPEDTAVINAMLANMAQNTVKARVSIGAGAPEDTAVINAMLANMANNTIKGRIAAGAGAPEDLTLDNLTTMGVSRFITKVKTADTVRNNTAVLADDPHLIIALAAGARYRVELLLVIRETAAAANFQGKLAYTAAISNGRGHGTFSVPGGSDFMQTFETWDFNWSVDLATVLNDGSVHVVLSIITTTAGNLSFQWAQQVATVGDTTLRADSFILAERILD